MEINSETNRSGTSGHGLQKDSVQTKSNQIQVPSISLPKGGGALKSIDEKFSVNAVNGSASFSVPLPITPGRNGFSPALSLSYNSGVGNSLFGLGWGVDFPAIQRKTDKQLPRYEEGDEDDVFMFSGVEDLVPFLDEDNNWKALDKTMGGYSIKQYRPRIEGSFSRIERITLSNSYTFYWKVTTKDNIVTFYGKSASHRISDPNDHTKTFKWLPEFSFDDKGNLMEFEFKEENLEGVENRLYERNRFIGLAKISNKHLKRVKYGNYKPYYPGYVTDSSDIDEIYNTNPTLASRQYFFEFVFDYGEHSNNLPTENLLWKARTDPFSEYRSGFEMRTYRLCERVLMFHSFEELKTVHGSETCLIKSLDFTYSDQASDIEQPLEVTYLKSIKQTGYLKAAEHYTSKSLPSMEFEYNELRWNTEIKTIAPESIINAPVGISGNYQWTDLYNEGISGILTEQADAWYYKSNLGGGEFTAAKRIAPKPSFLGISNGNLQLQDVEANGEKQLVIATDNLKGYFDLDDDNEWQPFRAFEQMPTQDFRDPNVKFIDLNGDGMPELVVSEENVFTWYPAKGKKGYDAAEFTSKPYDDEQGSAIVFNDGTQSIFLADMSGDGLTDIVRIRNGEINYWPNLGYGRFGSKVNMYHAPLFDHPEQFNTSYLHLADVSGTGATDILYLGKDRFQAWLNLSGNAWSTTCEINPFPPTEQPNQLNVVDLLGSGTSCIVWSSTLPSHVQAPMRYIDLMGGRKPHIMRLHKNNMGKETILEYKCSTHFYLEDKKEGRPWVTKLPFPVHCVSKTEVIDLVADLRFTNKYAYHHGYYDHAEREFRGFGLVEQIDTEEYAYLQNVNASNAADIVFHEHPLLTKTWFHTGAYLRNKKILDHFKHEYWYKDEFIIKQFGDLSKQEPELPDALLIGDLSTAELVEAYRACKGMMLRQEVFALDGSEKEKIPYSVATHNCHVKTLQPLNNNRFAVFLPHESEAIVFSYERNPNDPRTAHTLNLEIDDLGNVLKAASVVYPRKIRPVELTEDKIWGEQNRLHISLTEADFTKDILKPIAYRLRLPFQTKTYELKLKKQLTPGQLFSIVDLTAIATELPYEAMFSPNTDEKRLIEHVKTIYLKNDLLTPAKEGEYDSLGFSFESYQLAFTTSLLNDIYKKPAEASKVKTTMLVDGKYIDLQNEGHWWIRSGTVQYINSLTGETAKDAATRFYLPQSYTDPFGSKTSVSYYKDYHLFIQQTKDDLDNMMSVEAFDFRTLSPKKTKDVNGNFAEVAIDILGLVVGTAIMGKGNEADNLVNFTPDISPQQHQKFFANPLTNGRNLLQHATTRLVYDFTKIPCSVAIIVREEHHAVNPNPKLQYSFEYSGGLGDVLLKKIQAEPGDAPHRDLNGKLAKNSDGELDMQPAAHRWIGNGRTVLNNKGKPVKQYEPYFSDSHLYEVETELRETGVTPALHYDAAGRLFKTEMPDDTFSSVEYDSWMQRSFDQNDNCKKSKWHTDRINRNIDAALMQQGRDPLKEKEAADKAAIHGDTPTIVHTDSLGRTFYTIAHNNFNDFAGGTIKEEFYATNVILDFEGNLRAVIDARNNTVMDYKYDMLGNQVYQKSMDAGERWLLNDSMGKLVFAWDSKDQQFETAYDTLHRPLQLMATKLSTSTTTVFEKFQYVDTKGLTAAQLTALQAQNLMGKPITHYDSAGIERLKKCDFKGNTLESSRQLCKDFKIIADWKTPDTINVDGEIFASKSEFDALNRPVKVFTPHTTLIPASIIVPQYNEANLLNALSAKLNGSGEDTFFVRNIDYDAKGQRTSILYGNNTVTKYSYDPKTFRLLRLLTTRNTGTDKLQDLKYTYDAVGNITFIKDDALQSVFFNNRRVDPDCDYVYDSIYRLIQAKGREHIGNNTAPDAYDGQRTNLPHKGNGNQLQQYTQRYQYDSAGNMLLMQNQNSWNRTFTYRNTNNQLLTAAANNDPGTPFTYTYDAHGNMISMPHLPAMSWNFKDQLQHIGITASTENDFAGQAYYVYDAAGERIRKVVEKDNLTEERIYLGGFEIFRKRRNETIELERGTLHIMDGTKRIVLIDTRIKANHDAEASLIRYQYGNHLGTASLELDGSNDAKIISYEEYYPFGSTSYQATDQLREVPIKRYRYTGKERDEESGLEYHSARYYAPWLGRWMSCDPGGLIDGFNIFIYVNNNPIKMHDLNGMTGSKWQKVEVNNDPGAVYHIKEDSDMVQRDKAEFSERYHLDGGNQSIIFADDKTTVYSQDKIARDMKSMDRFDFYTKYKDELNYKTLDQLTSAMPKPEFKPPPEDKVKYMDPQSGLIGTSDQLADTNLAHGISNVNPGTGLGGAYSLAAVSLGASAKEAARMGKIGDGWAPIFTMAAAGGIALKKPSALQSAPAYKSAAFEASARDLKAPRGTTTNPIPAEELVRFKVVTRGRKIEPAVEHHIDTLMKRQYGSGMMKGRKPGQYQIAHDPALPWILTPDGQVANVFGQLVELNRVGTGQIRSTAGTIRKQNLLLPPDLQTFVRPAR